MFKISQFPQQLQDRIEARLATFRGLNKVPVIKHKHDADSLLNEYFQANSSHCIIISNPMPDSVTPRTDNTIAFEKMSITIRIIENAFSTEPAVTAIDLAEVVTQGLHNFRPSIPDWQGKILLHENKPWREIQKNNQRYEINIHFKALGSPTS